MANRVLILRWSSSAYDSLGGLLELTGQELTAQAHEVVLFSADAEDWPQQLLAVLQQGGFSFALTMSGIGVDLMLDRKPMWEVVKVPLFNWNCDHPCYFPTRHAKRSPYVLHGYVFPDHARYNTRHLAPNGAAFAVQLGIPPRALFPNSPRPLADRNGRILFSKSGADTNKIEADWRGHNQDLQQILFSAAEELFTRPTADFLPALQRIAEPFGMFLDGDSRLALLLLRELDNYIRFRRAKMGLLAPYMFGFVREAIEQAVDAVLSRPAEAIARADDTWSALKTPFGLQHSAQQITQFVRLHALNAPCRA